MQGRLKEGKETYALFLDVQKAYDSVWRNGLWFKLWEFVVRGKMWRVIKRMYGSLKRSEAFVAQGCGLSPILFSVFINGLLREAEEAEIGIDLSSGGRLGRLLFADDFVGVSESKDQL